MNNTFSFTEPTSFQNTRRLHGQTYTSGAGHFQFQRSTSKTNNASDFETNALEESLRRRLDSDLNDNTSQASQSTKNVDIQMLNLLNRIETAGREVDEQNIMLKRLSNDLSLLEAQRPELDLVLAKVDNFYQDIERQTKKR